MTRLDAEDRVWWWQPNLAALGSMIEQAGFEMLQCGKPYFVPLGPRYRVPQQGPLDILRRLRSPKGWEELVFFPAASLTPRTAARYWRPEPRSRKASPPCKRERAEVLSSRLRPRTGALAMQPPLRGWGWRSSS